ncbi:GNAT family protein [Gorillibacterium sp. CAU 1737]|uniref:GNAT family N-acetyltransferase n=1 Tax=Gorillibacterium sp. CAU 1737 TaxID=3140362 RepID=UPI0032602593
MTQKKQVQPIVQGDIQLRLIRLEDLQAYFKAGFEQDDEEIMRLTGTKTRFSLPQIESYLNRIVDDPSRYDFLICHSDGQIIGESVLNEIDEEVRSAHFRICLFRSDLCGKGTGSTAVKETVRFGFEELGMHRIDLEVFDFNERAYRSYLRAGFREEGRKRDAEWIDGRYVDVILMAILEEEWTTSIR